MSPKLKERRPLNSGSFFMCYVVRIPPVPSPASAHHFLCVLMCFFFDDKADLCPIGFAAKRHNSCFYDRMPIKALNVANCRRFFNKYKMCPGNTQRQRTKPRKGKSLQHTKHARVAGGGRTGGQLLVCPLGRTHNGPTTVHSLRGCVSFDLLVKKLKFYGLFFARCPAYRFAVKDSNSSRLSEASPPSPPPPLMA